MIRKQESENDSNHQEAGNRDVAVVTTNLSKDYGNFRALNNLNLSIPAGITYGLLGPNGAGKTTTVRILCGLIQQSSGEGYVFGHSMGRQIRKDIGYMPQDLALYLDLSVMDNIELYGRLHGLDREVLHKRARDLLELVGLSDWESKILSNLSGGMKRKVSLICSLIHNPKLILLDEPTVGVDPTLRASLWEYFGRINDGGSTILLTTHYMDEAMHCDRVGFIQGGRLIADGRPDEILRSTGTESLEEAFIALSAGSEG